ncbi:MAG: hypothetical protein CFE21_08770 [Bacteroidetes bacterium B1(2017)]|nr:MAG: hypothetical protein CFE21_08770 [Bacteroidetes bacterium B1(2017)]
MRPLLSLQNLIFISLCFFYISCTPNKKASSLPDPNDSLANTAAVKEISAQLEANSEDPELYYKRAQIYSNTKYLNRAEDDYLAAIALDSLNPLYHFSLARTLYAMNQTQRSAAQYEKAIALKPDYTEASLKLADLYFVVKEHSKSIALLNKVLLTDKGNAGVYHMLGMNYKELGDTGRAIYHFQTAIETDPTDFESNLYIANLYGARKNAIALDYYTAALKLRPKSADAWFAKAVFEQSVKNYRSALIDYRRVIDIDPGHFLSYYNVGYLNYELGMFDEAMRNWNICSRMNPSYARCFYMKGLLFEEQKNKADAKLNYKVALDLDPENALYQAGIKRVQ